MANNNETTIENPFNTGDVSTKKEKSPHQQPNYAELVEVGNAQPDYAELVEVKKGVGGHLKDFGVSLASGAASLPDIAIGIGDLYSGGRAGKAIEDSGIYKPGSGSDYWRDQKTINAKAQDQQRQSEDGIIDKAKFVLTNPTQITNAIGESLAPMVAGGLVGRGINIASKGKIGAAAAGALGEGTIMAGSQAESIRQQTDDGLLTGGQVGAAVATGVAGTAFGFLGGRIAQKFGFDDINNMMANGVRAEAVQEAAKTIPLSSIPKSILAGAVSEGILEELPQSFSEQALQNIALGKDWNENLDDAVVMGTLAGMAMGGGINAYTSTSRYMGQERNQDNDGTQQADINPDVPMLPGGSNALEGEFIPGNRGQATTDAQGRTNYEYDQFSTDADNLLGQGAGFNPMQGNYPENPDSPIAPTTPPLSRQMGINPEEGPLSTAAALAVDSGTTSAMLNAPAVTDTKQDEINNNAPLSNAAGLLNAPTENTSTSNSGQDEPTLTSTTDDGSLRQASDSQLRDESGLLSTTANSSGSESANDSSNNLERNGNSSVISNAIGDDGKDASRGINNVDSVSGIGEPSQATQRQSDRNNVNTVGNNSVLSEENTETATSSSAIRPATSDSQSRTVGPILGDDGQNKWFASQDKANAFIEKKKLNNDYQVVQNDKRFEIQPKIQSTENLGAIENTIPDSENSNLNNQNTISNIENNIDNTQKISTLEQQLANEKSVPKKTQIRQQIAELQGGLIQTPSELVSISEQNNSATPLRLGKVGGVEEIQALEQQLAVEKSVIKKVRLRKQIADLQKDNPVDQAAHAAATSIQNDLPEPTQAQIEAGNYKKGHIKVHGLDIAIENPRGSERRGTDPDGNKWAHTMSDHYGYIKRTVGADQENIDTYIGKNHDSDKVYVVDQIDQGTDGFDEHKVMLGFDSQEEAITAYKSNFDKGWKVGPVNEMTRDQFKDWLKSSDTTKPVSPKNLKESIENIRAEKIRQKNINDLHVGVYGSASIAELENSLNQLSKRIQKNHELSIGEMSGGKRSTRKAVASGAVDNFRKQKMDLEVYLKARKSGEVKQREKSVPEKAQVKFDEINTEIGLTHHIPRNLWDKSLKLSDIIHDLASMKTDGVKTNILYSKRLLNKIAKLNPGVQVHIVSDLDNSLDPIIQSIADQLQEGGFYAIDSGISYIYPKSSEWKGSLPELINHELIHAVTQKYIDANNLTPAQLESLEELKETLWNNNRENVDDLDSDVLDRINYAMLTSYPHEMFTVFGAETDSREILNQLGMLDKFDTLFDNVLKEATNDNGQIKQRSSGRVDQEGTSEGIPRDASGVPTTVSTVRATTSSNKNIERSTANQQTGVSITEENKVELASDKQNQGGNSRDNSNGNNKNVSKPADGITEEIRKGSTETKTDRSVERNTPNKSRNLSGNEGSEHSSTVDDVKSSEVEDQEKPLFSRISGDQKTGKTIEEVRQILIEHFDESVIEALEKQGKLKIIESKEGLKDTVRGYYTNGQVVLIANAATDSGGVIATFLHELGGHAGFQGMMDDARYKKLMDQFEKLVEQGHPFAVEAKRLAEREKILERQRLEMLPYLLSLAGQFDTLTDLQRSSFQKFISEIISNIKVWVFNKLGVNLNLQPDDIVELAYIMIENSSNKESVLGNPLDKRLFSRQSDNQNTSSTIQQVRDVLVARFGEDVVSELERQGKLEIIQDYDVEGVEGFYYNGKAVLVASNLTKESTVPTFLHELGGHGGFQNMMSEKQYQELMRQFDKLVEQGNPVAMAAKLLAEREQGTTRQKLEYLPYLLTLSSTMQQRNVIQRNALQKLINNIVAYVKAWAFDRLGINLNLNPDDMLVLSERMVDQIRKVSSLDLIRQKYQGTSQWMTAPNGANTHLSEQQWLQVRTPEFKKWFGDWENDTKNASQVLDENGEPKVVYHGTATEFNEFNEFKQGHGLLGDGIYLTDSFDTADMYANIRGNNGFVLPLFVNIRSAFKTSGNVSRDKVVEATRSGKYQGVVHQFDNQEYIIALESNQVKMAEGNTGTFNSESADIRFSRSTQDITDRLSENIKNLYSGNFKLPSMADAMKYGLMFLSRMQITDIYKKILPQLSVYDDLVHQMDADKNDIAAEADNIVREWSKLKDEEALANVMHEATLAQIDPAKPHQPGDDKVKYQQLHKAYNALSPEAQVMYKKARNAYSQHYAKVREAVRERILRSALSSERKADLLKKIEGSFGQIKGVYFPLARFGKYVVVVRNQNGDVESISRAETENEAIALREQLKQKYPQLEVDPVIRDQEYNALRDKVGRGFMSDLFDEVGNLGLDAKKQAEFEDTLGQLYLSSMPDLSWAKHGMHRKGTAGFSQNARRAFAQNMSSGAGYLAKLRYGDQLVAQLDEMKEYAKAQIKKDSSYKQPLASAVIDEMNARHENLMNAKGNAVSSLLTSMGFIYFLGLSPAAAMVNILQTPLVAYPILGAKFGFDKAGLELLKASADYAKGVGFEIPDFTDLDSFRNSLSDSIDPDIAKVLKEHEKQAYEKAVSAGVIDVTQAHDLAGIAQGEDSGVMWKMRPIMRVASLMFHHAERFNREVTFIAAYRLSKESGMADSDAYKQAVKMTYDGHFDYSASNRARFMQGNVAKVIFLFKQFGQNMIYTIARQTYQSIKGETKEERREARRAISAMLVTHALAAGVLGLPMVTTLLAVASMFGGSDDDPWDAEVALRNGLADMTSPTFSNLVMKGLSRGTPADISGRVGLDSMFLARAPDGLEGQKLYEQLILGNMGATVGMGANIAKGIQELGQGNYARALEDMLPTFAKNPFKSYRYATEGVQDKTGVDILNGNPVSGAGIFSQTIGFSPSQVRTAYEGKSAVYQQEQALKKRKSKLTAKWVRAKRNDDQEGMDSAWKDIQEFNDVNPKLRIKRINLMQSYHQNAKRIRDAENGVYLSKKYRDIGDYGRFAETD